jgi:hypothetical protein
MNRNQDLAGAELERSLREKAREAINAGRLPNRRPDSTWGGTGSGCHCALCGVPVKLDEAEIELEFPTDEVGPGQANLRVHVRCLAAWQLALDEMEAATSASGAGESSEPDADSAADRGTLQKPLHGRRISRRGRETHRRGPAGFRN